MLEHVPQPGFTDPDLFERLRAMSPADCDALPYGVIGFANDADATVTLYSAKESRDAGLPPERVMGLPLFGVVAQCMNNYMVAQRFEDALAEGKPLDATLPWVFTLRMRPTPVTIRLMAGPGHPMRYVAVLRQT